MPLTSSGAISLNEMHIEAGGSSGTTCTINDSDIRGLISASSGAEMSFDDWYGASSVIPYALNALGYSNTTGAAFNSVERITIESAGDSADFADLSAGKYGISGSFCSTTRNIFAGGTTGSNVNVIEYFTAASSGVDASDFGDTSAACRLGGIGQINNATVGVFNLGITSPTTVNTIEKVTMATAADSTSFGSLTKPRHWCGNASNATRGIFYAGDDASVGLNADMDYSTISSGGTAGDFGDTNHATARCSGCASSTRAVFDEGHVTNAMYSYVQIATLGNATDFGTPYYASGQNKMSGTCSAANATIGLFYGGVTAGGATEEKRIAKITIGTLGNGVLWGDLAGGGTASMLYGQASGNGCAASAG